MTKLHAFIERTFSRLRICTESTAVGLVAGLACSGAIAQDFPSRPIKMIVPFGAGTTTDIVARTTCEAMSKLLGQSIVVENRAGGGGVIGSSAVAKATPDGYTLVMGTASTHGINPSLYKNLPYDVMKDFVPIGFVGYTPNLLIVAANSLYQNLAELKAAAAKSPGLSFASAGTGTTGHLASELLKTKLGGQMVHVPYKEGGQALTDVMGGQAHFMFYHPAAVMPHLKAGRLRALGVSSAIKSAAAPGVVPIAQQGYPDFDLVSWFMVYAPIATPPAVVAKLRGAAGTAVTIAEVAEKFAGQGIETRAMSGDEMIAFNRGELTKWDAVVQRSGATAD
ncbi:Bug family tripartite tricarboxylate transporter substrate binding protein [Variovorax fucosicus]|uniref:Bug family tripartite tricarboxylate transporter substrate binding protein n=1 Tax=Variovorax fucosicus TaxID=3053517 RepID=UPI0025759A3B|nr:tripartite tricarboxylate transporter substrate-binding protein [Variovorax sp. J22G47]MDM0058878.1 tripartite tricarboxylate transporter substrate-binding protein [Variovorax sp. J22G47]